ncbi:MAG TPA: STAS domain-containing protein [Solimonas sp.]|nr:STAS domain-containing protein [Solimonas sp.]
MGLPAELTLPQIHELLKQADQLAAGGMLDLSGVSRADSAGLAFLLELERRARAQKRELRITGASEQVRSLVEFFELESALNFG